MPDVSDRLATALADRYRIERLVGEGGMATVYLARDLKHDRQVALKVLKPELGGFTVESREVLFHDQFAVATAPHANYDVSLDGTRFLVINPLERPQLNVVYGWLGELRARRAARR